MKKYICFICMLITSGWIFGFTAKPTDMDIQSNTSSEVPQSIPVQLAYKFSGRYTITERSDWAQYVNGSYIGLTSRETRGYMNPAGSVQDGIAYTGYFYVLENTLRNNVKAARALDEVQDTSFVVRYDGSIRFKKDNRYPQFRNFPVFPAVPVKAGDRWQSQAERMVDPKNNKQFTCLPFVAEYEFIGKEEYKGKSVFRIKAKFATRFNFADRIRIMDDNLKSATGSHDMTILLDAETCAVMMMIDRLDETFSYSDGNTVRFKGTTSWFTDIPVRVEDGNLYQRASQIVKKVTENAPVLPISHDDIFNGLHNDNVDSTDNSKNTSAVSSISGFAIEHTPQGLRFSVQDIRFKADSAQIMKEESWRLDAIADMLRSESDGTFLVEGHTASVGKPDGEKQLSIERAKTVIKELVKRGFNEAQFMFKGYGGTKPIADNTEISGRAQNRRVEITVLQ